jgi:4-hydroxyphenylpyruvate dioxygenase
VVLVNRRVDGIASVVLEPWEGCRHYHDDIDSRFDLAPARLAALRELGLFYDETDNGAFLHLYTEVLGGRVFFEFVQRVGGYDGYGAANAPVRMAAQRRARLSEKDHSAVSRG